MVEFYLLTFPRFPLRKKEHKSYFGKNRTHDFPTSRCAAHLLDHSGDEQLNNSITQRFLRNCNPTLTHADSKSLIITVRYYCCGYLQEIYTDRTACMPQNLQASQSSWCKHQDVMQTRCSHDVRARGRHLRLDMMTHRDAFPISHNFCRLRYIMVSIRTQPSTQKNCITKDSCIHTRTYTCARSVRNGQA